MKRIRSGQLKLFINYCLNYSWHVIQFFRDKSGFERIFHAVKFSEIAKPIQKRKESTIYYQNINNSYQINELYQLNSK